MDPSGATHEGLGEAGGVYRLLYIGGDIEQNVYSADALSRGEVSPWSAKGNKPHTLALSESDVSREQHGIPSVVEMGDYSCPPASKLVDADLAHSVFDGDERIRSAE